MSLSCEPGGGLELRNVYAVAGKWMDSVSNKFRYIGTVTASVSLGWTVARIGV